MQLTRFTDLGLRVLMYLTGTDPGVPVTIAEIAERFAVPHNHLTKVVQFMGQQGWVLTVRGKGGGLRLARPPADYRLGDVVRLLEPEGPLIDCAQPPCALRLGCQLKGALDVAQQAFYDSLNRLTLADAIAPPTREALVRLHRPPPPP